MTWFISRVLAGSDQVFPGCVSDCCCHHQELLRVQLLVCVAVREAKAASAWERGASGANCSSAFSWETACVLPCQEEVLCSTGVWQLWQFPLLRLTVI